MKDPHLNAKEIEKLIRYGKVLATRLKDNTAFAKLANQLDYLHAVDAAQFKPKSHPNQNLKKRLVRSKSHANFAESEHDEFFNHKRKVVYETHLAQLVMTHLAPFMSVVSKVSAIITEDIEKMFAFADENHRTLASKMYLYFVADFDIKVLFKTDDKAHFHGEIMRVLNSKNPEDFYKHMCIQRVYITFFTEKGLAKPEMHQALQEHWTIQVDLTKLLADVIKFRQNEVHFKNNVRLERPHVGKITKQSIGILSPQTLADLSIEDNLKFAGKLPLHQAGMLRFMMTTKGDFAAAGMFDHDLPQLCGPSGNTAMRLALANQDSAKLSANEKKLFAFAIALHHVALGSHTIDECFMIASKTAFSDYVRGIYLSIFPTEIKEKAEFNSLWLAIQALNSEYADILPGVSNANSHTLSLTGNKPTHPVAHFAHLDLHSSYRISTTQQEQMISHLIRSLRDNYFSYGFVIASKASEQKLRNSQNFYTAGFFALPRVPLPAIKPDSKFLIWQQFVNKVFTLFDGARREKFILEMLKLEKKMLLLSKTCLDLLTPEALLEKILADFEIEAGFSAVIAIKPTDGVGGIITPAEFKKLLAGGHPINDLGTTVQLEQHGKLSHRLQFYILGQYFKDHVNEFFSPKDRELLIDLARAQYPHMLDSENKLPLVKIISIFYRLLGTEEFNNSFDWKSFAKERSQLNLHYNGQSVPNMLNAGSIWVQLFDRYGYAGFFSVPSTFGFLQSLGCFPSLPKIGAPKTSTNKHLKTILDVTLPFFASNDKNTGVKIPAASSQAAIML